jgi:hypothetical protein
MHSGSSSIEGSLCAYWTRSRHAFTGRIFRNPKNWKTEIPSLTPVTFRYSVFQNYSFRPTPHLLKSASKWSPRICPGSLEHAPDGDSRSLDSIVHRRYPCKFLGVHSVAARARVDSMSSDRAWVGEPIKMKAAQEIARGGFFLRLNCH